MNDGIAAYGVALWENSHCTLVACDNNCFVQLQSRDFLTELCCCYALLIINFLFQYYVFIACQIPKQFFVLVCLVLDSSLTVSVWLSY